MSAAAHGEPLPLGDDGLPYSKGMMARALIAAGVPAEPAYQLARRLELDLAERGASVGRRSSGSRSSRTRCSARRRARARSARLRRLAELQALDVPIIVLIGGSTGTGKSTVAAEVAHRLGITRVASTDFIRQTMRAFFSPEFMPTIHYSSFEAGEALDDEVTGDPTIVGFVEQCRHVCVGVDAAIQRALTEGWSMVLEGVHLVPGLAADASSTARCSCTSCSRSRDEDVHRMHFHVRDAATGGIARDGQVPRPARRHPAHPDLHRRAGATRERPGGRECERGADDRPRDRARDATLPSGRERA